MIPVKMAAKSRMGMETGKWVMVLNKTERTGMPNRTGSPRLISHVHSIGKNIGKIMLLSNVLNLRESFRSSRHGEHTISNTIKEWNTSSISHRQFKYA